GPRLFGLPPGADFAKDLLIGLEQRLKPHPPEAWAQVEIYVNTQRMRRRLIDLLAAGPARFLPQIRLVSSLGDQALLPPAAPPLRLRLELAQLIRKLLDAQPDLAARTATFDLADSLADLMAEMQSEGVAPAALHDLDVSHLSAHWARTRSFITLVEHYFDTAAPEGLAAEARNRLAAEQLCQEWQSAPPKHPVIIAGSTGSRGPTAMLMAAVAQLPQGAVVLPGFDFTLPAKVWDGLDRVLESEDHPQFRFRRLADRLDLHPTDTRPWIADSEPNPARNRLISLALRPAPVTDQWLDEGRNLTDIAQATETLTLIEAPSPRAEATAIALRLRKAAEDGQIAALITPDRMLTRQVTAALDRWRIEPDDSAGQPLQLSAPGRFLRQVADLFGQKLTAEALLALLKHPLTASTADIRGPHLLWTRELELHVRRYSVAFPDAGALTTWAAKKKQDDGRAGWAAWLGDLLAGLDSAVIVPLSDHCDRHIALANALAAGPGAAGSGALWLKPAGEKSAAVLDELRTEAGHGGLLSPVEFSDLLYAVLSREEVRDPISPHPGVMIWGTLEARVQGADLVILGGLNEGSWPQIPAPDPWLNREMRANLGLLLPERRIGLSAHDFQQAVAAREVVLTRAIRDAEAETVASRWLNRLTNLLDGLERQGGREALQAMRARGEECLKLAAQIDTPAAQIPPAHRPAPCPPVEARPEKLSVTRIQTLIRDPYAIYAETILGLRALDPLAQQPDPPLRGIILHKIMELFVEAGVNPDPQIANADLMDIADRVLSEMAPWPAARALWRARLERVADEFLTQEASRRSRGTPAALEVKGAVVLDNGFRLTAEADRIDLLNDATLAIYDYKTGAPPTDKQVLYFDKQLLLEAAIAERAGFGEIAATEVSHAAYIGLGSKSGEGKNQLRSGLADETLDRLGALIDQYAQRTQGYASRRAIFKRDEHRDYDHLARYGEWDETDDPIEQEVGNAS
ncbi:double-strand break repair protein AddB, partial [Actibacterium sp.]|uniref:double-strand break repair protein AddB n=1 Tax=Actibacterium sp. TaxID=1872125 RepID=UPI00356933A8